MKRILFITAFVPGKIAAGENFSRQLINDLAKQHYIDLVFFKYAKNDDYIVEAQNVRVLKVFKNSLIIKLLNFSMFPWLFPLFAVRFNFWRLFLIKKIIHKWNYDLIIFDFSQTFLYAKFIYGIPLILNSHDVIAQRYSRIHYSIFTPFVRFSERYVLNNPDAKIFTLSEKDCILIRHFYSVDASPSDVYLDKSVINSRPSTPGDYFVFFANWNRPDNVNGLEWFLKNVYPDLKKEFQFLIIGAGLPGHFISELKDYSNIEYKGFIDDPYPIISNAVALLSPLFTGAGIKVKVIESLACGTPIIGTDVSFEGISEQYSQFFKVAINCEDFISIINNFTFEFSKKLELKEQFIKSYQNKAIAAYVNTNI